MLSKQPSAPKREQPSNDHSDFYQQTQFSSAGLPSTSGAEKSNQNRLAILLFFSTLLGSLLGIFANLGDATALVLPVYDLANPAKQLVIAGSNTILGKELTLPPEQRGEALGDRLSMSQKWEYEFIENTREQIKLPVAGKVDRYVEVEILDIGTINGIELAKQGKVHLLAASEPLTDWDELQLAQAGLDIRCATVIGYDVIVFVSDLDNQLPVISVDYLREILNGQINDWIEVGGVQRPIRVLARRGSGTTVHVLNNLTGSDQYRDHFFECESNSQCLGATLNIPGSIYWVSAAWLHTQPPPYLRPIRIQFEDGQSIDPLGEDFDPDQYPRELVRPLFMYVLSGDSIDPISSDLAKEFFSYVRGLRGQATLEQHHFYTYFSPPPGVVVQLPAGFGPVEGGGPPVTCQY